MEVGTFHSSKEPPLAGTQSGVREGRQGTEGRVKGDKGRILATNSSQAGPWATLNAKQRS